VGLSRSVFICALLGVFSAVAEAKDNELFEVFKTSSRVGFYSAGTKTWNFSNRTGTTPENACSRLRKGGKTSYSNSFLVLGEFQCQIDDENQTFVLIHSLPIERVNAGSEIFLVDKRDVFLD